MQEPVIGVLRRSSFDRLLRPRSIAIVGASSTPATLGAGVLSNLERASFNGKLYLINPRRTEIRGRPCLPSIDNLPDGVDCAVLAIPRGEVYDAVTACSRRGVGAVIIFSAGFAESSPEGLADQDRLARLAREHNMIIEGPNCLGMVNGVDGIHLTFVVTPPDRLKGRKGVAVVSQSGAMAAVLGVSLRSYGLGISYSVSTGNEATSGVEDYVEYLIDDEHTAVIAMIVELFRKPFRFLDLVQRARGKGKSIVLLHPGRTRVARASATTHTGAMAGDFNVMHTKVSHAGVVMVDTLEELLDVCQLLIRCSSLPAGGTAVVTESGAFKAVTLDLCEDIELPLPALSDKTTTALRAVLPNFILPTNPLDLTAQGLVDPDLYRKTLPPLLDDEQYGSVVLTIILTDESTSNLKFPLILEALETIRPAKPVIFAALDEGALISPLFVQRLRAVGVPFFPTPERAFRALARLSHFAAQNGQRQSASVATRSTVRLPAGVIPEYRSKEILASSGIPIPVGALASTLEEAQRIASRIGFPVVLKAQSAQLSHKSDVGGVVLNLPDPEALAAAWEHLRHDLAHALPHLILDGVLVERMEKKGVELTVGARNDPDWGPVLLIGFGGIIAEALHDVRVLPPELGTEAIVDELNRLKNAPVLRGFRGSPELDVSAVAEIISRLGQLMLCHPEILEVDINPVVVYPKGQGAVALDALLVTRSFAD